MQLGQSDDGHSVHRACTHINSQEHMTKVQAGLGQQSLARFGFLSRDEE
jgi:hypothetical protein